MKLKKHPFIVVAIITSTFISSCGLKSEPYIQEKLQNQVFHIPIHCEKSQVSKTLEFIEQIPHSGSIIEIALQEDCDYQYSSLDVPRIIAEELSKKSYKMLILGDDSNTGFQATYTQIDWQWLKHLDVPFLMTSTDVSTFPGEYTNPNFSRWAILPILQWATPQKYTTPLQYMLHFSWSLTEVDIKKCDALYPVTISYSGSQVFFAPPDSSIEYSKYLKAAKNRASCYAQVIR